MQAPSFPLLPECQLLIVRSALTEPFQMNLTFRHAGLFFIVHQQDFPFPLLFWCWFFFCDLTHLLQPIHSKSTVHPLYAMQCRFWQSQQHLSCWHCPSALPSSSLFHIRASRFVFHIRLCKSAYSSWQGPGCQRQRCTLWSGCFTHHTDFFIFWPASHVQRSKWFILWFFLVTVSTVWFI